MMGSQPLFLPAGGQGSSEQEVKGPLGSTQEVEADLRAPMGEKKPQEHIGVHTLYILQYVF